MNNLVFQDESKQYNVNLYHKVYIEMLCHCDKANPCETGGILIGNYSQNQTVANILQITPPPKNSLHARFNFFRGSGGLKRVLDKSWSQGQYYLGEWHYHPNASSSPSHIDIKQMISLSQNKKLNCPEPILIIVGGHKDLWNISVHIYVDNHEITLNELYYP